LRLASSKIKNTKNVIANVVKPACGGQDQHKNRQAGYILIKVNIRNNMMDGCSSVQGDHHVLRTRDDIIWVLLWFHGRRLLSYPVNGIP